jgi:hypothetical protein
LKKKIRKKYQGGKLEREGGDKRHGNNSDAFAKQFKMKVSIVTVVIKVMEYVKKRIIMIICYQNLIFNA